MGELSEDAARALHGDVAGRLRDVAAERPLPPLGTRIFARITTLGDLAKIALSVVTSLAALMFLALVVMEWRTVRTLVEPIQVPDALAKEGFTPEVMSSALLDRISTITAYDSTRWRPASIAPGWGTTDLNIPLLNTSVASLAGLAKTLWGPQDQRVSGEVVRAAGSDTYQVRLRIKDPVNGWIALTPQEARPWSSKNDQVAMLFEPVLYDLLLHTAPLSLANYDYITEVQAYREPADGKRLRADLCDLHQAGEIVEAIKTCVNKCAPRDKALAFVLWGDLLDKASEIHGDNKDLLIDALDKYAAAVDTRDANDIAYTHWATTLSKLGRETESLRKYTQGIFDFGDGYYAHYDFAEQLSGAPAADPGAHAAGAANPKSLEQAADQYERAARIEPGNAWNLTRWGQTLLRLQRPDEAREKFQKAIRLDGTNAPARHGLCAAEQPIAFERGEDPACRRASEITIAQAKKAKPQPASNGPPCAR